MNYARKNIQEMSGYVPGEQPKGRTYIKLNTNENPYPPTPKVAEAVNGFIHERLRLYPDPVALDLRKCAADLFGFTGNNVIAGNGSDDLLTIAVRTFVDAGAKIAYPSPTYSLYHVLAGLQDAEVIEIDLDADFNYPEALVEKARDAKLLFLARPNAPTGVAEPMANIREICAKFKGVVWIDEAYADFAEDNCLELVKEFDNVVVSRTFSKSYSLAGIRLGLAFACEALIDEMMKVKDSYNVNMLTQLIGLTALQDQEYLKGTVKKIRTTRANAKQQLEEMGCSVLETQTNFLFVKTPVDPAVAFASLREEGYLVRYFPGGRTGEYLRVTVGTDEEMAGFISSMKKICG